MVDCLINGIRGTKYSENIRRFCLRQQYYSVAAYESLRLYFNKHLPSKRTLQMWYSSIDGWPGISDDAIEIIKERATLYKEKENHPLHLCLMLDDMAIRKNIGWNVDKFEGFVTTTNSSHQNVTQRKVASNAMVFMAVGPDFKVPLAYEFINGVAAIDRAIILNELIKRIEAVGAKVISITGDGANIAVANVMGANYDDHQPYFHNPSNPEQMIYFILDPPHMLKLIRKHFATRKLFHQSQLIDWNLLELITERQSEENFNLCKLTQAHINWDQQPMVVKLAAQVFSRTNADLLRQLKDDGFKQFSNCDTTAEFLQKFNDAFDILNVTKKSQKNHGFKQPLCDKSAEKIFRFGDQFKNFIKALEIERDTEDTTMRIPVLRSLEKTGFIGFYNNFVCLEGIYKDFVKNGPLDVFYTIQFGQDHLESLFSLVRNSVGRNDNPNTNEFRGAFRKLLICHPLITSVGHNIITNATEILTVSSSKKPNAQRNKPPESQEYELEIDYALLLQQQKNKMDPYDHHMVANVAQSIEKRLIEKVEKNKCPKCINILQRSNNKMQDELLVKNPSNLQPCISTVDIVIFSNAVVDLISKHRSQGNDYNAVWKTILCNLDMNDLFENVDFANHPVSLQQLSDHKEDFVVQLIKAYLTLKSQKIGKKLTEGEHGELIRKRKQKAVQFSGQ